jgi:hypothetical protein
VAFSEGDLTTYWRHCFRNRAAVEASDECGCFSCGALFSPSQIEEWLDEPAQPELGLSAAQSCTATCPTCTFDAVLPGSAVPLSAELLAAMRQRFFTEIDDGIRLGPTGPG